jgi:hypothetical protein
MTEREDGKVREANGDSTEISEIGTASEETRGTVGMRPEGLSSQP